MEFLSYVQQHVRQESWQDFHDDLFTIPKTIRRLYLILCFDIGTRGDGMDEAFAFYGYSGDSLIHEILEGFRFVNLPQISGLIQKAFTYWRDPNSPMHSDPVPWRRMGEDLGDVHGQYYQQTEDLFAKVGAIINELGEDELHRTD